MSALDISGLALVLLISATPSFAESRDRLDGWGPFKFTMSRTEAIEAGKARVDAFSKAFGSVIHYDAEIGGLPYDARVEFTRDQSAIARIELTEGEWTVGDDKRVYFDVTEADCLSRTAKYEASVTAKYGKPDGPAIDGVDRIFVVRRYSYDFGDGNRIEVKSLYAPASSDQKPFCQQKIDYISTKVGKNNDTF